MNDPINVSDKGSVFILTGAGISAESGIATFRDSDGLWENHRVDDVATPDGWRRDRELVWRFYSERREACAKAEPNVAHIALAEMQAALGDRFFLVTQNVDDLHERGGSTNVVHMHGELFISRCANVRCNVRHEDRGSYKTLSDIPKCERCGSVMRPDIVWFSEMPMHMPRISSAMKRSTTLVVIGSSGSVYPAAGFVSTAHARGLWTIYVGPVPPENASEFDQIMLGTATTVVPGLFKARP